MFAQDNSPTLSVVVPCYNEEEVICQTHDELSRTLATICEDYEIIYVNDGSADSTHLQLVAIQKSDSHVRVINFARNFGHQAAVTAGLEHAEGDAVVLIDADLQDPPEAIKVMFDRWKEGFEVAYGQRTERDGETVFKRVTASAFYKLLNKLSDTKIPSDTGDFRLMDRKVVDALGAMPERDRYIRGMVSWIGFRQIAVPYHRKARAAGESKYPLWKMVRFATDGVLSFSLMPLRFATTLGLIASSLALIGIVYAVYGRLFSTGVLYGWTLPFVASLFLGGAQLICLGIIGEYVGRIYREGKQRPMYLIESSKGFAESNYPENQRPFDKRAA